MDKLLEAFTKTLEINNWEMSAFMSNGTYATVTADTLREKMTGVTEIGKFLIAFFSLWEINDWSLGDPETGEDVEDAVFVREFRHTYSQIKSNR